MAEKLAPVVGKVWRVVGIVWRVLRTLKKNGISGRRMTSVGPFWVMLEVIRLYLIMV